ncbi:MAG: helix-turn-helix domain-containing protein [Deltaproteobacteria bacterium]|nr:helix-turn-helix domain-containing protein [Deltaproteobacteria bacterium]
MTGRHAGADRSGAGAVGAERIGAYLARQRELRGLSPEELAGQMRIPLRSLQRLEAGAFDHDPDGFARGFVRTVATALGLPPDETIARMLPEAAGPDDAAAAGALTRLARAVGLAVALGALGASSWMWLTSGPSRTLAPTFRAREDGLVVRRDAVRALAEEQGLLGGSTGADAGTLAPLPPAPAAGVPAPGAEAAAGAAPGAVPGS